MLLSIWGHLSYFISDFHEFLILITLTVVVVFGGIYWIFKSSMPEKNKKIILSIFFIFFWFVILYSGFEAYFRYRFDESDSLGFLNVTKRWNDRHVVYNNYQYRDRNFDIEKPPGTIRIGVMGDSNTFGYGIKNVNNRFSNILEDKLNKSGYKSQVYNFGISGLDTWNEILDYKNKESKFKPDILIWQYFLNDVEATKSAGTKILQNAGNKIPPILKLLSDHSYFFDYVYWRFASGYNKTFQELRNADMQQYYIKSVYSYHKNLIDNFTNQLESQNTKIVVLVLPFMKFFPNYPATEIHNRMDKVFKDDGVNSVIDLLPYLKGKNSKDLVVGPYDTHPNEYVHNLAAQKLYDSILPLLSKTKTGTTIKSQ